MGAGRRASGIWGSVLLAGMVLAMGGTARAQAVPTAMGPGTSVRLGAGVSAYEVDYGQRWLGGGHTWMDVNPTWRYGVEGEATWLRFHDDIGTRESTYLVGPRVVILPGAVSPYAKAMVGAGLFQYPFGYGHGGYFVVAGAAGVDLRLGRSWQVRALEVEYQSWPQFTFGALHPYGVSMGISYRLFRGSTEPGGLRR